MRTCRGEYVSIGRFGWGGGVDTTTYADLDHQLVGILLTRTGMSAPASARSIHDFWTTLYQTIDD
ncbi:hypothetical protein [Streptomyces sp. NPDC015350]|uniref:hypothetical protein n=1 Tax=Streptomyces sp. NPDC015350 TaxID=3364955 RepID=UPI0036FCE604